MAFLLIETKCWGLLHQEEQHIQFMEDKEMI